MTEIEESHIDLILSRARRAISPGLPDVFNEAAPAMGEMTDERLMAAYESLASILSIHGETYMPLFELLHREVQRRKENTSLVSLAHAIHARRMDV